MKRVLFTFLVAVVAVASQACASAGYTGLTGLSVPGYEAAGVIAGNQAMVASIAGQQGWLPYSPYGYGNVPICRIQDLAGLPPVSQPVIVRVSKSKGHQARDIIYGTMAGGGLGLLADRGFVRIGIGDWAIDRGALAGVAIGAGGAGFWTNHEQELCLLLPVKATP